MLLFHFGPRSTSPHLLAAPNSTLRAQSHMLASCRAPCVGYFLRCLLSPFLPGYGSCLSNATSQLTMKGMLFLNCCICWRRSKTFVWSVTSRAQQRTLIFMKNVTVWALPGHCACKMHLLIFPNILLPGKGLASLAEPCYDTFISVGMKICFLFVICQKEWTSVIKDVQSKNVTFC